MKLTPENIAAIETFLTRIENGETATAVCPVGNTKNSKNSIYGHFAQVLRALGVDVIRKRGIANSAEWKEFYAWRAARAADKQREAVSV